MKYKKTIPLLAALAYVGGTAISSVHAQASDQAVSSFTAERNAQVLRLLPFEDRADFESASRGLVARFDGEIKDAAGKTVWDTRTYDFLSADKATDSVNPSLWRLARLNTSAGLFKVGERIYQARGMDLANMTIIEGEAGLIVVDPLTVQETARAALDLYYQNRPRKPVVAVVYTHSHLDHFGGVRGVVDEADVKSGKVRIFAPAGFMEHAISENVLAGSAMLRRGQYQGGSILPRGAHGQVDAGLGKSAARAGRVTLIAPTDSIGKPYESHRVAGVEVEFQLTPGTEAPSEMNLYFPELRALCMSENTAMSMHNLLTPRGAEVRDAKGWAFYLDESLTRYGDRSDVMFASHHWPVWGAEGIQTMLADQRDMYAFIHDRTLHFLNQGLTPLEIADAIKALPGKLNSKWHARSYYGVLSFNVRAVYQRYMGFYDGNPATLDPLPPVESSKRHVQSMGGSAKVIELMNQALQSGEYRWAAQLGNYLVFAEPQNATARGLQAQALEQLGYQSEAATWRNMYLTGAKELRSAASSGSSLVTSDLAKATTPNMFFDLLAVRMDSAKAVERDITINWSFADLSEVYAITVRNGVMTYRKNKPHAKADTSVAMSKSTLDRIATRQTDFAAAIKNGEIQINGEKAQLAWLMSTMVSFNPGFNIVEP